MEVTWDSAKSVTNKRKHRVSFEEAAKLFTSGVDYLEIFDEAHSESEERFLAIGPIGRGIVLVVFTEEEEDTVRIISARFATSEERSLFHTHMRQVHD